MAKKSELPFYHEIIVERDGKKYRGGYRVKGGKFPTITASYGGSSKTTQLGGTPAQALAELLIMEMVNEEARKSK